MTDLVKLAAERLEASRAAAPPPSKKQELGGNPDCEVCHGFGYVEYERMRDDPRFGKLEICPSCAEGVLQPPALGLPLRFQEASFENFEVARNPQMALAVAACRELVEGLRDRVLLYGAPGLGKTHLLAASVKAARQGGAAAWYWEMPDLLAHLRERVRDEERPLEAEIMALSSPTALLAIDDYGAHNATDWAQEQCYRILNHRYGSGAATMITSNVPIESLDERIRSRWRDGLVLCEGKDVRREGA